MKTINLVVAGSVDHGKSTLIGRLLYETGSLSAAKMAEIAEASEALGLDEIHYEFIMDSFKTEREEGKTIDTSQIVLRPMGMNKQFTIIDTPGHVEYLKNAITGATQANAALIVIDATTKLPESTKRLFFLTKLLGIQQIVVVVNKMDLIDYSISKYSPRVMEIIDFVKGVTKMPKFVPVSAKEGENLIKTSSKMKWWGHNKPLLKFLEKLKPHPSLDTYALRFSVQDNYFERDDVIIVGRVESGTIGEGDVLKVPLNHNTHNRECRLMQVHKIFSGKKYKKVAMAGECVGLKFTESYKIPRGEILAHIDSPTPYSTEVHARIFWLDKKPMPEGFEFKFRNLTREVKAQVVEVRGIVDTDDLRIIAIREIRQNQIADITIKFSEPIYVQYFSEVPSLGRFSMNWYGKVRGGGIVERYFV